MNFLCGRGAEEPTVYVKDLKVPAPFMKKLRSLRVHVEIFLASLAITAFFTHQRSHFEKKGAGLFKM